MFYLSCSGIEVYVVQKKGVKTMSKIGELLSVLEGGGYRLGMLYISCSGLEVYVVKEG